MLEAPRVDPVDRPGGLRRSPRATVTRAAFHSVATEIPAGRLTSAELAEELGIAEDWIVSRTGIRERPVAAPEDRLSDYAARAGGRALDTAGLRRRTSTS